MSNKIKKESNITLYDESNNKYDVEFISFSDGCENCLLPIDEIGSNFIDQVNVRIVSAHRDIIRIGLVIDALYVNNLGKPKRLMMPYIPNARADRVFLKGNGLPVMTTSDIIDSYGFEEIHVTDPHSSVSENAFNNSKLVITNATAVFSDMYQELNKKHGDFVIISPDKGSLNKCKMIVAKFELEMVCANKKRNLDTGRIESIELVGDIDLEGKAALIFDDLSDGGGTFIPLANELRDKGADKVILAVSHGIFSKGLDVLDGIDYIYAHGLVGDYVTAFDIQKFNQRNK